MDRLILNLLKRLKRLFPLHPLTLTLLAFFLAFFGAIFVEYAPPLMPDAPKWFFKFYSLVVTLTAVFYAIFAAGKTAENLFFKRRRVSRSAARRLSDRLISPESLTPGQTVATAVASYMLTIYAFALIYESIAASNSARFNTPLDLGSAAYFSIVTIATVGYGDILANGRLARILVSLEILIGVAYQVFFFSVIAGLIRRESKTLTDDGS